VRAREEGSVNYIGVSIAREGLSRTAFVQFATRQRVRWDGESPEQAINIPRW
jgi:hypothetical protein